VGIGGVFVFSIKQKLKKSVFTASDIDQWIQENHKKTDAEFNDKYAATIVTNMILVSEMMKILRIESIEALDVALVEGLLAKD
jgi:exopolyphosphatase/pppGpp-phosphohydrolase